MITQTQTAGNAQRTEDEAQRIQRRQPRIGRRPGRAEPGRDPTASQALVPQPVPIAEVGTAVRVASGQVGIIRDALEVAGNLAYVVEFQGYATGDAWQCIPARELKGAQI